MDTAFLLDMYLQIIRRYKDGTRLPLPNDDHRVEFLLFDIMPNYEKIKPRLQNLSYALDSMYWYQMSEI